MTEKTFSAFEEKQKNKLIKLKEDLAKHGARYFGPIQEDDYFNLLLLRKFKKNDHQTSSSKEDRYKLIHLAAELHHQQVQRTWLALFTDLIFVAVIVKFASQIKENYKTDTKYNDRTGMMKAIGESLVFFVPFFVLWLELNVTLIRFADIEGHIGGMLDDSLLFLFLCGIIMLSVQIQVDQELFDETGTENFVGGMLFSFLCLLLLHILYFVKIPASHSYCKRRMITYSISIVVLSLGFINILREVSILLSSAIVLYTTLVSFRVHPNIEINKYYGIVSIKEYSLRFGIFTMIVLGESVLAILIDPEITNSRYVTVYISFVLIYILKLIYFGIEAEDNCHALNEIDIPGSVIWVFAHLPLGFFLLSLGTGMKLLFFAADLEKCPIEFRIVSIISTTLTLFTMIIIRTAHEKYIWSTVSWVRLLPIILGPFGIFFTADATETVLWCFLLGFITYVMDIYFIKQYETKVRYYPELEEKTLFLSHDEEYPLKYLCIDWLKCNTRDRQLEITKRNNFIVLDKHTFEHGHETHNSHDHSHGDSHGNSHGNSHGSHGDGEEEEVHKLTWFGEFTDLFFVAIIINFADQFKIMTINEHTSHWHRLLLEGAAWFLTFFMVWFELTVLFIRFTSLSSLLDKSIKLLYLIGLVTMALQMNPDDFLFDSFDGFNYGLLICLTTLIVVHAMYYEKLDTCKIYCQRRLYVYGFCEVFLLICIAVDDRIFRIIVTILVDLIILYNSANSFRVVKLLKVEEYCGYSEWMFEQIEERFGLIVMITTGESILAVITSSDNDFLNRIEDYVVIFAAFGIMFFMRNLYFESHNLKEHHHALFNKGTPGSCMWVILHGVVGYLLMLVGTGWKLIFKSLKNELRRGAEAKVAYLWLLSTAQACIILVVYLLRRTHKKFIVSGLGMAVRLFVLFMILFGPVFINKSMFFALWSLFWTFINFGLDHLFIERFQIEIHTKLRQEYSEHDNDNKIILSNELGDNQAMTPTHTDMVYGDDKL